MNMDEHPLEKYKENVLPFIISKKEEFELLGYDKVDIEQIWGFLKMKKWRKNCEEKMLHDIVNDILRVSVSEYMNFVQIESYKSPNFFDENGMEALKELL